MEDAVILFLCLVSVTIAHAPEEAGMLLGQEEVKVDRHRKQWLFRVKHRNNSGKTWHSHQLIPSAQILDNFSKVGDEIHHTFT